MDLQPQKNQDPDSPLEVDANSSLLPVNPPETPSSSDRDFLLEDALPRQATDDLNEAVELRNSALRMEADRLKQEDEEEEEETPVKRSRGSTHSSGAYSTLLSLLAILTMLLAVRWIVPPMIEEVRYAWLRGQLRAEYESSGDALQGVSLGGLNQVSQMIGQQVGPSVVHINVRHQGEGFEKRLRDLMRDGGDDVPDPMLLMGQGSGVIVDKQGHILTNHHVIEPGGTVDVSLSDGRRAVASVVGIDPMTDLALLKIDLPSLMPISWGDSDAVEVGSLVWAAGSPFGLRSSFTLGILSGKHRTDLRGNRYEQVAREGAAYRDLMQSDVAVNPGNSGGPMVNARGELVGINTAIVGESYRGISFAIPSNVAKNVYERLMSAGEFQRGWLGVQLVDIPLDISENSQSKDPSEKLSEEDPILPLRGAMIGSLVVRGSSPAADAGLEVGDRIVRFDGKEISDRFELIRLIGETEIGKKVPIDIVRAGQEMTFLITVARRPVEVNSNR